MKKNEIKKTYLKKINELKNTMKLIMIKIIQKFLMLNMIN